MTDDDDRRQRRLLGDFFQDGAAAVWNFWNLKFLTVGTVKRVEMRHLDNFCRNRSNRGRDMAIFRYFPKMATVRHLGFVLRVWGPPMKAFGGLYHGAKFGWNRCSSFDNMHFSILRVWLENAYSGPKIVFWGLTFWIQSHVNKSQKAHLCANPRRLSYHA